VVHILLWADNGISSLNACMGDGVAMWPLWCLV
jgi:hypothetical protein